MKLILVPTDFSKPSKNAINYAIALAKQIKCKILLITVLSPGADIKTTNLAKLHESNLKTAHKDADRLIAEIQSKFGKVDIAFECAEGFDVVGEIERYAKKYKADLIVMGSKGASGLKKIMFGSNAASVIENSTVPVVMVPERAQPGPIKKLVYATDAKNFSTEVKIVANIAKSLNASMEVLHVILEGKEQSAVSREKLVALAKYPKIHLHILQAKKIGKGINDFITSQKADVVAMFTHSLDFKEKILGRSVTRELAFHSDTPLLAFNRG